MKLLSPAPSAYASPAPGVHFPQVTPQKYLDLAVDVCNASVEQLLVAHPGAVAEDGSDSHGHGGHGPAAGMKRDQALWLCFLAVFRGPEPRRFSDRLWVLKLGFWMMHDVQSLLERMS